MSEDKNLTASSTPSVAIGFSRRNIALLLAAMVGLAVLVFLLMSGGSGASTAYARGHEADRSQSADGSRMRRNRVAFCDHSDQQCGECAGNITVTWANGDTEIVPLSKFTGGVAHYVTTSNLDSTVVSATADIYAGWSGQFNLSHGPCGPSPSPTPTPSVSQTETPTPSPTPTS